MNQRHFPSWPKRVPKTQIYPVTPLFELVETSARRYPERAAIIYYGRRITYRDFWSSVTGLASTLAGLGVKKGDRVALYMQNCPHFAMGYLAIMRAGGVVVPLNPMLVEGELQRLLADCGAKAVITTSELHPRLMKPCAELGIKDIICGSLADYLPAENSAMPVPDFLTQAPPAPRESLAWLEAVKGKGPVPEVELAPDDLCLLPYTAGSTGVPKGCMHTHGTVTSNVLGATGWAGFNSSTVSLAALPFFHVTGMIHSFLAPLSVGATVVLLTRWDRLAALMAIEEYGVSQWASITTMLVDLLAAPGVDQRNLTSLSFVGGGGAPLPATLSEKFKNLTGLDFAEGYGLTETISQTHWNPPDKVRPGSIGIPVFGVDARIVDIISLQEVPVGEQGEIVINGNQVLKGYWENPEATREAFLELEGKPFFRTGDIGRMDEDGYFYIQDRLKRMINAAGFKVWPAEVESTLYRHPAVLEACVIGVPDTQRVENVKAVIVPRPEYSGQVTAKEIIDWAKGEMSAYKYPRIVEFVESLPKSGAGKILWRQLQEAELEKIGK